MKRGPSCKWPDVNRKWFRVLLTCGGTNESVVLLWGCFWDGWVGLMKQGGACVGPENRRWKEWLLRRGAKESDLARVGTLCYQVRLKLHDYTLSSLKSYFIYPIHYPPLDTLLKIRQIFKHPILSMIDDQYEYQSGSVREPWCFIHLLNTPTHPPVCEKHCRQAAEQK